MGFDALEADLGRRSARHQRERILRRRRRHAVAAAGRSSPAESCSMHHGQAHMETGATAVCWI